MQCALCRAFIGWPRLCVLDEPVVALDIEAYEHFCTLVEEAKRRGCTMIISSHVLDPIERFCQRVGVLRDGVLRDVRGGGGDAPAQAWIVKATPLEQVETVLRRCGAGTIERHEDGWRFTVAMPRTEIPVIVAEVVKAGCAVHGIWPEGENLLGAIRREGR